MKCKMILNIPLITFNNGQTYPQVGLGTWKVNQSCIDKMFVERIPLKLNLATTKSIKWNHVGIF